MNGPSYYNDAKREAYVSQIVNTSVQRSKFYAERCRRNKCKKSNDSTVIASAFPSMWT